MSKKSWSWNPGQGSVKVIESGTIRSTGYGFLLVFYSNFVPKTHVRFWDIRPWNPGYGSLKVIETDTDRSTAYDFLLTFHSNHELISYGFRDKRWFQSKIANFSHPRVFCDPWNWVSVMGSKTRMMGLSGWTRSLTISSTMWIQSTNVSDRQTPDDSKDRAYAWRRAVKKLLYIYL